jgi:hypothetical protein
MQHLHIPYAILTGLLLSRIENTIKFKKNLVFLSIFMIILFSTFLLPSVFEPKMSLFKDGRLQEPEVGDMITLINMTQPDSVIFLGQVIIPNFDYFEDDERNSVDMWVYMANNYSYTKQLIRENADKPMFFIEDYICFHSDNCKFLKDNFEWSKISTKNGINLIRLEINKDIIKNFHYK